MTNKDSLKDKQKEASENGKVGNLSLGVLQEYQLKILWKTFSRVSMTE